MGVKFNGATMSKSQYQTIITSHNISLEPNGEGIEFAQCWIEVNGVLRINGIRIVYFFFYI